jgi:hypothetical protein
MLLFSFAQIEYLSFLITSVKAMQGVSTTSCMSVDTENTSPRRRYVGAIEKQSVELCPSMHAAAAKAVVTSRDRAAYARPLYSG